ncbi:MAG: tRNA lysidine(34) synthetase TilS [Xanthobacteraceae bacterium]
MSKSASAADDASAISAAESGTLFENYKSVPALVLAVSGGPDSTALMVMAARWRASLRKGPELLAVTIDHGLRAESAREARAVKRLAQRLGVRHRTLRWIGRKPSTALQHAAREVRYRLLAEAARGAGAGHILTGHTLDDQAETVLLRMARGSGLTGLGGMARVVPLDGLRLVRPLLDLPKRRLLATLAAVGIPFADDPSNRDPRFTRARLRALLPALAGEGLDARRLALLARRLRRADETIELAIDVAAQAVSERPWAARNPIVLDAGKFARLPAEVALRLLGRAVSQCATEGSVQLGKLELLYEALGATQIGDGPGRLRRTLAGALVTLAADRLVVEMAPARGASARRKRLTTSGQGSRGQQKRR